VTDSEMIDELLADAGERMAKHELGDVHRDA